MPSRGIHRGIALYALPERDRPDLSTIFSRIKSWGLDSTETHRKHDIPAFKAATMAAGRVLPAAFRAA